MRDNTQCQSSCQQWLARNRLEYSSQLNECSQKVCRKTFEALVSLRFLESVRQGFLFGSQPMARLSSRMLSHTHILWNAKLLSARILWTFCSCKIPPRKARWIPVQHHTSKNTCSNSVFGNGSCLEYCSSPMDIFTFQWETGKFCISCHVESTR